MNSMVTQSSAEDEKSAENFLKELIGKRLWVKITDGRQFVGVLMCTDRNVNIVMRDVIEFPADVDNPTDDMCRKLALITIRGVHVQQIFIADDMTVPEYVV